VSCGRGGGVDTARRGGGNGKRMKGGVGAREKEAVRKGADGGSRRGEERRGWGAAVPTGAVVGRGWQIHFVKKESTNKRVRKKMEKTSL